MSAFHKEMPHCRGPAWKGRVFGQWLKAHLRSYRDEGYLFSFPELSEWVIIFRPLWAESVLERSPYPHHKPIGCFLAGQARLMSFARWCRGSWNRHYSLVFIGVCVAGFAFDQSSHETREMFFPLQYLLPVWIMWEPQNSQGIQCAETYPLYLFIFLLLIPIQQTSCILGTKPTQFFVFCVVVWLI